MPIDDRIGKAEAFKLIVGQDRGSGKYLGDVSSFEIKPEDVDKVYLTIKKMQRCYHSYPEYPVSKYFAESFSKVENAYLATNSKAFQEAVKDLMMDIELE
jgi:hypothetical protein